MTSIWQIRGKNRVVPFLDTVYNGMSTVACLNCYTVFIINALYAVIKTSFIFHSARLK